MTIVDKLLKTRMKRKRYFWGMLICNAILGAVYKMLETTPQSSNYYVVIWLIIVSIELYAVTMIIRRCHDKNFSWKTTWIFIILAMLPVPFLSWIPFIVLMFGESYDGDNEWGPGQHNALKEKTAINGENYKSDTTYSYTNIDRENIGTVHKTHIDVDNKIEKDKNRRTGNLDSRRIVYIAIGLVLLIPCIILFNDQFDLYIKPRIIENSYPTTKGRDIQSLIEEASIHVLENEKSAKIKYSRYPRGIMLKEREIKNTPVFFSLPSGYIGKGEPVYIIGKMMNWYKIMPYSGSGEGWVPQEDLKKM